MISKEIAKLKPLILYIAKHKINNAIKQRVLTVNISIYYSKLAKKLM